MSPQLFEVKVSSGARCVGSIPETTETGKMTVVGPETTTLDSPLVVEITPMEEGFWDRVDGSLDFGVSLTRANRTTQFTLGSEMNYRTFRSQTGFPCCPLFLVDMPSSTTPAKRCELVVQTKYVRPVPAFPQSRQGRPSHRAFRGRLDVHACYGLSTCRWPCAVLCLPGFDHFVTSMAAGIATRSGRPLPGQDLHLLEQRAFARHTWTSTPVGKIDEIIASPCRFDSKGQRLPHISPWALGIRPGGRSLPGDCGLSIAHEPS